MKGRPAGTPKSRDPARKTRQRTVRKRDLCDVKIKVTEYQAGAGAEFRDGDGGLALEDGALEALARIRDGPFWVIQPNNPAGPDGLPVPVKHRHTLQDSDAIKKSSAHRWLMAKQHDARRNQRPSRWKPTGEAGATARKHADAAGMTFLAASFW